MKKLILYISILFVIGGCSDVLDISPNNIIGEDKVAKDPALLDAFLSNVYKNTRFQTGAWFEGQATLAVCSGEHNVFAGWQAPNAAAFKIIDETGAHGLLEYWPYGNIRSTNEIVEILAASDFNEDFKEEKTAEARFLRAFMYFELVKRYGGVPLITIPQSPDLPYDELYVSRNSEKEIYDFIATEMDDIFESLPDVIDKNEYGRATRWAAMALKSRAMLYAGSIAKYGSVQIDGMVGIPAGEANSYFQKAYDAANLVITTGPHSLFNEDADPMYNYQKLFTTDKNSEAILAVVYSADLLKMHSWNHHAMPDGFRAGWGSNFPVYLEWVEKYEYIDGTSGNLDDADLNNNTLFDIDGLMHQKDPRFRATVFYPETPWQGRKVYFHANTVGDQSNIVDPDWTSKAPARNFKKSGFLARKRVNEDIQLPPFASDETDWMVFRLGEMFLNAAEAAFEQSDDTEAMRLINIIRNRAGMPDKMSLTLEEVRNERQVELAFEEHNYWDLRRWRVAVETLNGKGFNGITWTYDADQLKYKLKKKLADYGKIRTFSERNYYLPIGAGRIADNPNLLENPGYEASTPEE